MELDRAVIALQKATGWHDIFRTKYDEVCLRFNMHQAPSIVGLEQTNTSHRNYYLNFPGLDEIPLSFLVMEVPTNNSTVLHRTLGGMLHSHRGLPSKVVMTPMLDSKYLAIQEWHWGGVLHNTEGPAKIVYQGYHCDDTHPTTLDPLKPSQVVQFWDSAQLMYYTNGQREVWPKAYTAQIEAGWALRDREPPFALIRKEGIRSFWSQASVFMFLPDPKENDTGMQFFVSKLLVHGHQEEVESGRIQRFGRCMFEWNFNGTNYSGIEKEDACVKMMRWFEDDMLARIDPWGDFFKTQQDKMILMAKIKEFGF